MQSYPKILNIGHRLLRSLLEDEVTVEEKIDGSQFSFQAVSREVKSGLSDLSAYYYIFKSRSRELPIPVNDKLFKAAVDYICSISSQLKIGWTYRGEVLCKPKHNTIQYGRVPKHNIMIFDIDRGEQDFLTYEEKVEEAARLDLDVVPLLHRGKIDDSETLCELLSKKSVLGEGENRPLLEGIVIKNYSKFDQYGKVLMGKWVRAEFKEAHQKNWKNANPNRGDVIQKLIEIYRHENRWKKSVQHLKEKGALTGTPQDIGKLMKEVQTDVYTEEREAIEKALFQWGWKQIGRGITRGLPEWYKDQLAKEQFDEVT